MTAQKIKEAALKQFSKSGYEGASLSKIASEVGIKKPSIYAHFRSKEDLFLTVYREVLVEHVHWIEKIVDEMKQNSVEEKLYRILYFFSCELEGYDEEKLEFLKRTTIFPPSFLKERIRAQFLEVEQQLSRILIKVFAEGIKQKLIRPENMEDLLYAYYSLLDGTEIHGFYYGREHVAQKLQKRWDIFWRGIAL
ncbi:TetR/AcrR family transcriptional regulator [Thermoflavimicrobium daqui]|nr:TetR/AcrR family transcriptional regulator [Thermoflavimicrobium daqui]